MDWIMQTLTQLGEHFGLVLIACVELAAAVALLIKGQHKKKGTPIQTAWGRGARDLLLQELDRRSDRVFILMLLWGKVRRQYTGCRGASSSGRPPRRS